MKIKKYWTCQADVLFVRRNVQNHVCEDRFPPDPIRTNRDAANAVRSLLGDLLIEAACVIMMNTPGRVIGAARIAVGDPGSCIVSPRQVVTAGLLSGASSIIFAHNHPGGSSVPSEADWSIVKRIYTACAAVDMPLVDALILYGNDADRVLSMREQPRWPR